MVNIQSPTAEIRRGKKKKKEGRTNHSMKIYMVSLFHRATIKQASLTKNTANNNIIQTKPRFGRLLRPPAWKRSGSIFWKVRDRRRNRRR